MSTAYTGGIVVVNWHTKELKKFLIIIKWQSKPSHQQVQQWWIFGRNVRLKVNLKQTFVAREPHSITWMTRHKTFTTSWALSYRTTERMSGRAREREREKKLFLHTRRFYHPKIHVIALALFKVSLRRVVFGFGSSSIFFLSFFAHYYLRAAHNFYSFISLIHLRVLSVQCKYFIDLNKVRPLDVIIFVSLARSFGRMCVCVQSVKMVSRQFVFFLKLLFVHTTVNASASAERDGLSDINSLNQSVYGGPCVRRICYALLCL